MIPKWSSCILVFSRSEFTWVLLNWWHICFHHISYGSYREKWLNYKSNYIILDNMKFMNYVCSAVSPKGQLILVPVFTLPSFPISFIFYLEIHQSNLVFEGIFLSNYDPHFVLFVRTVNLKCLLCSINHFVAEVSIEIVIIIIQHKPLLIRE